MRREPVGVVAAVVPWNVPQFVAAAKLAPALLTGCTVVLKPSPESPLDAYLLGEIAKEAGLPEGVLSILPADREVSEYLVGHPGIDKVSFTGWSRRAGAPVMEVASRNLTRVTLELGGKSAAVVLPDADLATAVPGIVSAAWMNNGQACVAQTRILLPRSRYDEFADAFAAAAGALVVGDPLDPATQVGPLVARRQQQRNLDYIRIGQEEGAKILTGGGRPHGLDRGWSSSRPSSGTSTTPCGSPGRRSRAGDLPPPVRRRGRGREDRQRLRLRAERQRLDGGQSRTASTSRGRSVPARTSVNTFSLDMLGHGRLQELGAGAGVRARGVRRVPRAQDDPPAGRLGGLVVGDRSAGGRGRPLRLHRLRPCRPPRPGGLPARHRHAVASGQAETDANEKILEAAKSCPVEAIMITLLGSGEPVFPRRTEAGEVGRDPEKKSLFEWFHSAVGVLSW